MEIIEKGKIPGIDEVSFLKGSNGLYAFFVDDDEDSYTTRFNYESYKVMSDCLLRICERKSDGTKKYGIISSHGNNPLLSCVFDKIKPYDGNMLLAYIGENKYFINAWGEVFSSKIYEMRNSSK